MAMGDLFITIFSIFVVYLMVSGIYFSRCPEVSPEDDLVEVPNKRDELLARVRTYMKQHGISEDWLLKHGLEKETLTWEPGSIFGRTVRRREFGHKLPFSPLERASDADLRDILRRGTALIRYKNGVDCCRNREVI